MSIEKFIERVCVQTAVYWGYPVNDGYGSKTYADPVEISVRWEDKMYVVNDKDGKEIGADVKVLVTEDLDIEGQLCLCTLDDLEDSSYVLDSGQDYPYPYQVSNTFEILVVEKIPMIKSTTEFVRFAYLRKRLSNG
jgi:hypothetical protein